MKHTTIALVIAFIIATANIPNNCVVATEQQQAEQLGKNPFIHLMVKSRHTHTQPEKWMKQTNKQAKIVLD